MEVLRTCPFGHTCERIHDNQIERCTLYVQIDGVDPNGDKTERTECALVWQPILTLDVASVNRSQQAVMEGTRNKLFGLINEAKTLENSAN
jgi:hypothetical protein